MIRLAILFLFIASRWWIISASPTPFMIPVGEMHNIILKPLVRGDIITIMGPGPFLITGRQGVAGTTTYTAFALTREGYTRKDLVDFRRVHTTETGLSALSESELTGTIVPGEQVLVRDYLLLPNTHPALEDLKIKPEKWSFARRAALVSSTFRGAVGGSEMDAIERWFDLLPDSHRRSNLVLAPR